MEKLNGIILNPSAVSRARYELGLPNRYRGNRKKLTYEYWIKVVDFLGRKNNVAKSIIKKARTNRNCFPYKIPGNPEHLKELATHMHTIYTKLLGAFRDVFAEFVWGNFPSRK